MCLGERSFAAAAPGLWLLSALVCVAGPAAAQDLSVDLSAGSVAYEPLAATVRADNITAALRYESGERLWIYGGGGVPLRSGDSSWLSTGTGGRIQRRLSGRVTPGIDIGAHGYLFRDAILSARGSGAVIDALPFVGIPAGTGRVEVRAGWRGHTQSYGGVRESRGVVEAGVRAVYGTSVLRTEVDAKWVRAPEGGFPAAGASLVYAGRPLRFWLRAGKWLDADLDEISWSAGLGLAIARRSTLWARVWEDAPDPLFWNLPRRSWGVGMTQRLGRAPAPDRRVLAAATRDEDGVVITLPVSAARGSALFVAGDFTTWQPLPMTREGTLWILRLRLEPGIYRYAFRTAEGRWFVPDSVPGRRDDGLGGHVAILAVMAGPKP